MPPDGAADTLHAEARRLYAAGDLPGALAALERAASHSLPNVAVLNDLAVLLRHAGRHDEAIATLRRAVATDRSQPVPHCNLANSLRANGDLAGALDSYRSSLALDPDNPFTLNNVAAALLDAGDHDGAIAASRRAISLRPDLPALHSNLLYALHFHPDSTPESLRREHEVWAQQYGAPAPAPPALPSPPSDKLRIGYVSPDFNQHVVSRFLLPILAHHDRSRFEIFCYSNLSASPDAATGRIQELCDRWRPIERLTDDAAAQQIRQDDIHILVDLTAHMANNRLPLFARKPAPIQVTYLAYPGTTGLAAVDYRLTDPHLDPPGTDSYYPERSIRLPESYWCYAPPADVVIPLPAIRDPQSLLTFGSLNTFRKVSRPALETWVRLLRAVPESRLQLHCGTGPHRAAILYLFSSHDVSPDRIHFVGPVPLADYFRLYDGIDIALDPFPYAGGTTTLDAAYMGVPTVTLAGRTAVGRGGVSINANLDLLDLIAHTSDDYVRIALALASDRPRLVHFRNTLRRRMQSSPLMNAPRFTRNLETAYREMGASARR